MGRNSSYSQFRDDNYLETDETILCSTMTTGT